MNMQQRIDLFYQNISYAKEKSLVQINALQTFIEQQLTALTKKILDKLENHKKQIESNIQFYYQINENDTLKAYFENMLSSQLIQELTVFDVEEQSQMQHQQDQLQANQVYPILDQEDKLKEVYTILKKAVNLFQEQYSNSFLSLNTKTVDFSLKSLQYQSDFSLSQDRQHANIILQSNQETQNANLIIESQYLKKKELSINFEKKIDLSKESPNHLPPQDSFSFVKCFSVLDDNRRAVVCTRAHLLLVDLQKSKVLKYTMLKGAISTYPTCIQPLYSYEYEFEEVSAGEFQENSIHSQIINQESDFQNNIYAINGGKNIRQDIHQTQMIEQNQSKRVRKQNLIAVGMGNLNQSIDIIIFNLRNLQKLIRLPGHVRTICKLIQPQLDYNILFTISSDKKIFVWDLTQSNPIQIENTNHQQSINEAFMISEKQLATFSLNGEIYLWDVEYTEQIPHKFKRITKKVIIQRSCLSLYIGQVIMSSDKFFFSITSSGIIDQKYFLEMNDFQSKYLIKQELPHKVIGLNTLSVGMDVYVIVTYSLQAFFEVYKIDTIQPNQIKCQLHCQVNFPLTDLNIQSVIESPRIQFIQKTNDLSKILVAFSLEENISIYSIQIE